MGVEPAAPGALDILGLPVAGERDQAHACCRRRAGAAPPRSRPISGKPMSSSTTSGLKIVTASALRSRRTPQGLVSVEPQELRQRHRPRPDCHRRRVLAAARRRAGVGGHGGARRTSMSGRRISKGRALAWPALAAVTLPSCISHQALHDREADAEAALRSGRASARSARTARRSSAAVPWQMPTPLSVTEITACAVFAAQLDPDLAARVGVLGGVGEKIGDALHQPRAVAVDVQRLKARDDGDPWRFSRSSGSTRLHRLGQ